MDAKTTTNYFKPNQQILIPRPASSGQLIRAWKTRVERERTVFTNREKTESTKSSKSWETDNIFAGNILLLAFLC